MRFFKKDLFNAPTIKKGEELVSYLKISKNRILRSTLCIIKK